jgi:hypothetical protein
MRSSSVISPNVKTQAPFSSVLRFAAAETSEVLARRATIILKDFIFECKKYETSQVFVATPLADAFVGKSSDWARTRFGHVIGPGIFVAN